jgi:hypothetical protein
MEIRRTFELHALDESSKVVIPICVRPDARDAFSDSELKTLLDALSASNVGDRHVLLVPADEYSMLEQQEHIKAWIRRHREAYHAHYKSIELIDDWRAAHRDDWEHNQTVLSRILSLSNDPHDKDDISSPELYSFSLLLNKALTEDAESATKFTGGLKIGRTTEQARAHILKELVDIICFWAAGEVICYNHNMKSVREMESHASLLGVSSRKPGEVFEGQPFFAQVSFVAARPVLTARATADSAQALIGVGMYQPARALVHVSTEIQILQKKPQSPSLPDAQTQTQPQKQTQPKSPAQIQKQPSSPTVPHTAPPVARVSWVPQPLPQLAEESVETDSVLSAPPLPPLQPGFFAPIPRHADKNRAQSTSSLLFTYNPDRDNETLPLSAGSRYCGGLLLSPPRRSQPPYRPKSAAESDAGFHKTAAAITPRA